MTNNALSSLLLSRGKDRLYFEPGTPEWELIDKLIYEDKNPIVRDYIGFHNKPEGWDNMNEELREYYKPSLFGSYKFSSGEYEHILVHLTKTIDEYERWVCGDGEVYSLGNGTFSYSYMGDGRTEPEVVTL